MTDFNIILDKWKELVNLKDYVGALVLIDSNLHLELGIESKSDLFALKGKTLSMQVFGMTLEKQRITKGHPPKISYDNQLLNQAITCFNKSIELKPDNLLAYENKALALGRKGDFQEAIKCARAALDIDPENITILFNLSKWYKDIFRFNKSIFYANKLIRNKKTIRENILAGAYFNRGIAQFSLGLPDYEQSLKSAIALASDPEIKKSYSIIFEEVRQEFNSDK